MTKTKQVRVTLENYKYLEKRGEKHNLSSMSAILNHLIKFSRMRSDRRDHEAFRDAFFLFEKRVDRLVEQGNRDQAKITSLKNELREERKGKRRLLKQIEVLCSKNKLAKAHFEQTKGLSRVKEELDQALKRCSEWAEKCEKLEEGVEKWKYKPPPIEPPQKPMIAEVPKILTPIQRSPINNVRVEPIEQRPKIDAKLKNEKIAITTTTTTTVELPKPIDTEKKKPIMVTCELDGKQRNLDTDCQRCYKVMECKSYARALGV